MYRFLEQQLRELEPMLQTDYPDKIVHGDLFLENTMFKPDDTFIAFIDFEEVSKGARLLDVAMTVAGCCYTPADELQLAPTQALLEAYHRYG